MACMRQKFQSVKEGDSYARSRGTEHGSSPTCNTGWNARMPDERSARLPDEWRHTVDITHELNAIIGSLNLIEATSNNELYQD